MSDNLITQTTVSTVPSGSVIATEDIGSAHYQKVVVALTDGTTINGLLDVGQLAMAASIPVVIASDQSSITVDLSATDNAVLDQIEVNTSYGDNTGGGVEAGSLRVTLANDSTGLLSVDDNGGSLTIDNADITTIAGAVSGSEMQVDVITSALPTGAATAANQLADGHNVTIDNASGGSAVNIQDGGNSITVDNGGTFVVQEDGAALTALQLIDDAVATLGTSTYSEATTKGNIIGAVRNDTLAALANTDNEIAPLQVNASGALYIQEGTALDVSGATVIVDGSGVTQPISAASLPLPSGAATAANQSTGNTSLSTIAGAVSGTEMQVDVLTMPSTAVTNTGTFAVQEDGAALTALQLIDDTVYTDDTSTHATGTSKGLGMMAAATPTDGSVDANDIGMLSMSTDRRLLVDSQIVGTDAALDVSAATVTVDGSGVTQPISGTVTANLSATDNAVLDQIEVNTSYGDNTGGGVESGSLRVTLANDSTGLLSVDDNGGSLTIDNADITTIAGAVSGSEMQVDVITSALPTGAATAANQLADGHNVTVDNASGGSAVNIQDGGNSITVDNGGTFAVQVDNMGSAVDTNNSTTTPLGGSATYTGTGTDMLGYAAVAITLYADVDSATDGMTFQFSTDNTNWDDIYTFTMDVSASDTRRFQFSVTAQYFRVVYTNGGGAQSAFRVQTILHTVDIDTSIHRLVDNVSPDRSANVVKSALIAQAAGSGNFVPVAATSGGNLKMSVQEFSDGVDVGNGAVGSETLRVTIASDSTGLISVDDNGGSLTVDNAALSIAGGGVEASALRVTLASDSTGLLSVDDNGGSLTVDGTITASNAAGDVAHDAADSGNPIKTGAKAVNFDGTAPGTAVAENDRVNHIADVYGRQFVETAHPNHWHVSADYASAQTNTTVKAAPGAGLKLYITDIVISNGATAGNITLLDGSGGSVVFELYPAVSGGAAMPWRTPIDLTANTLLAITSTTVTTHSVTISGYTAP